MKKLELVEPDLDRYAFDFDFCDFKNGWAQMDTAHDASWYGNWANPIQLKVVTYAEGDVTICECENEEEFVREVRRIVNMHKENLDDSWTGIDTMCQDEIESRMLAMGLGDCFHGEGEAMSSQPATAAA